MCFFEKIIVADIGIENKVPEIETLKPLKPTEHHKALKGSFSK